jgi:hypothetical protein
MLDALRNGTSFPVSPIRGIVSTAKKYDEQAGALRWHANKRAETVVGGAAAASLSTSRRFIDPLNGS